MKKLFYLLIDKMLQWHEFEKNEQLRRQYKMPASFGFNGKDIKIHGKGTIQAGEGSYICNYSMIQLEEGFNVRIGNKCSISHNVRMYTASKIPDYDFSNKKAVPEKKGDIIIGDFVWIGANVVITPGVHIGDNSVIGANSVVTKDIPAFSICGGVPAKLIRMKKHCGNPSFPG